MSERLFGVDAFTDRPFAGNPAAVVLLSGERDETWMQLVAREMNLSETAFVRRDGDGFSLRWFTPTVEVDLCGHATLASAHTLWETGELETGEEACFKTRSGLLTARRQGELIELDFPARRPDEAEPPPDLIHALGSTAVWVGRNALDYLVEMPSDRVVREMRPDVHRLTEVAANLVIVTAPDSTGQYDFVSRVFAPALGLDEDPVTGAAHCLLGPYWAGRLQKDELVGYQTSARGGVVRVRPEGERVLLGGHAVTTMRAELLA